VMGRVRTLLVGGGKAESGVSCIVMREGCEDAWFVVGLAWCGWYGWRGGFGIVMFVWRLRCEVHGLVWEGMTTDDLQLQEDMQ